MTRVSIVTGGASGIGRATVDALLASGGSVVVIDRPSAELNELTKLDRVLIVEGDVTDAEVNHAAVSLAHSEFGGLDAIILNAGVPASGDIVTMPIEIFDRTIEVNVRGVLLGIRAAVPALRRRGGGRIVITASTSGINADPNMWA
ncbi:MAG: SDR family oxidoreductase, partial [Ilumatobacteraceae bacterium]|nr:SDR family oxidoreductase [Ilumatobacteraceae bacterium]